MKKLIILVSLICGIAQASTNGYLYSGSSILTTNDVRISVVDWTPTNTYWWVDAADASTITMIAGAVSQWNDKSSRTNHLRQPTAVNQPFYMPNSLNGKPIIDFGPFYTNAVAGMFMTCTTSNYPYTVFAIYKGGNFIVTSTPTWNDYHQGDVTGSVYGTFLHGTYAATQVKLGMGFCAGTPIDSIWFFRSGNYQLFCQLTAPYQAGYFNTLCKDRNNRTGGNQYAEVIAYNSLLNNTERHKVEGYLAWKWGLVADLPANHPYKTAKPVR